MLTVLRSVKMLRHCLVPVASGKNPGLFIVLLVQEEPGVYVHMLMYIGMHVCMHVCACACVYAYLCMCIHICLYVCLYVSACMYLL